MPIFYPVCFIGEMANKFCECHRYSAFQTHRGEFAFAGDRSLPAMDGAPGEGFVGASCSQDRGDNVVSESGKRLTDSLWASEDLSCRSEIRRDEQAGRRSPEWAGAADCQRAISLDASECLTEMSNLSGPPLVRSTALEDLTSIRDRSAWFNLREELISEQTEDGLTTDCIAFKYSSDSESKNMNQETQQTPQSNFDCHSTNISRNTFKKDSLFTKLPCDTVAENGSDDSSLHSDVYSKPDISNDSETSVAQATAATEIQKTPPQSSAATKSLVPVAVFKGLFAVRFTRTSPVQLTPSTQLQLYVMQHSPSEWFLWTLAVT